MQNNDSQLGREPSQEERDKELAAAGVDVRKLHDMLMAHGEEMLGRAPASPTEKAMALRGLAKKQGMTSWTR